MRVGVRAAGLNFRDVLVALGLSVGEATIGGEGAGVVLEVGPGVQGIAPGDRVMGMLPSAFGPVTVADPRALAPVPAGWSFAQAAAIPIAFVTAYYGLLDLARLRGGERVLIHAGAGGVGMAAIQLARHLGAEVFATASPSQVGGAGSAGPRQAHIASSRSLDFREEFLALTGGEGVDVVLNSLAREYVDASLELLPRGGRFIEMGKTDLRDPVAIAAEHPGVEYRAFDLIDDRSERVREILLEVLALFEQGALEHVPLTAWDVRRAPEAFRHMSPGAPRRQERPRAPHPLRPRRHRADYGRHRPAGRHPGQAPRAHAAGRQRGAGQPPWSPGRGRPRARSGAAGAGRAGHDRDLRRDRPRGAAGAARAGARRAPAAHRHPRRGGARRRRHRQPHGARIWTVCSLPRWMRRGTCTS